MRTMKHLGIAAALLSMLFAVPVFARDIKIPADAANFYKSNKVAMQAVTFPNQCKMEIAGNLFLPGR